MIDKDAGSKECLDVGKILTYANRDLELKKRIEEEKIFKKNLPVKIVQGIMEIRWPALNPGPPI